MCWRWTRSVCRRSRTYAWTSSVGWGTRRPPVPIRTPACVAETRRQEVHAFESCEWNLSASATGSVRNSRARGSASVAFSEQVRKRCVVDGLVVRRRLRRELTPALDTRGTPHDAHLAAGPDVE